MKPNQKKSRRRAYYFGHFAEFITALYFQFQAYHILARRYKTHVGEIDLIIRRGQHIIFVEVKARRDKSAVDIVTVRSQRRITDSARLYIAKQPQYANFTLRFDVIIWHGLSLTHHKNAWLDHQ